MAQMSVPEAARALGKSQETIRRKLRSGELLGIQKTTPQGYVWMVEMDSDGVGDDDSAAVQILTRQLELREAEVEQLLRIISAQAGVVEPPRPGLWARLVAWLRA